MKQIKIGNSLAHDVIAFCAVFLSIMKWFISNPFTHWFNV